jgi:hypothetical protein
LPEFITLALRHLFISFKTNIALKGPELNRDRSNENAGSWRDLLQSLAK